jgi:hypothetical protein
MLNESQEQHEMLLENIHPSGAEEWFCPTCGRRFLMQWPPAYNKVILVAGDEMAIHSGGRGNLNLESLQTSQETQNGQEEEPVVYDEVRLRVWSDWMEAVDFDRFWNS